MNILGSADETNGCQSVALLIVGLLCCLDQALVIAKTQVVVGAHVDDFSSVLKLYSRTLRGNDRSLAFDKASLFDSFYFFCINI